MHFFISNFLKTTILILIFATDVCFCTNARPNVIVMLVDDFGWGDVGANWKSTTTTPNMNMMAENGLRFTDFHAAASYCTPSRAALLTGRLGLRTGVTKLFGTDSLGGLSTNEITIADVLKQNGYHTFAIGKWHLGHRPEFNPVNHGFQDYFGVPYSLDNGCMTYPGINYPRCPSCQQLRNNMTDDDGCYVNPNALPLFKNFQIVEQPLNLRNLSHQYVVNFEENIKLATEENLPFFGYIPFSHMHVPHGHDKKFDGISQRGVWFDTLTELDATVGYMLNILKKNHVENDTFVFLFGDNGPWEAKCDLTGSPGPFTGLYQKLHGGGGASCKFTTWEGGHRVPGLAYWPTKIKPGVSNAFVNAMDLFPTLSKLSDSKMPTDRGFDGVDISQILFEEREAVLHKIFFHPQIDDGNLTAARYGDFKIVYQSGGRDGYSCGNEIGPIMIHNPPLLFDLAVDPAEEIPLDTSTTQHQIILNEVQKALKKKMYDIEMDKKSTVDWGSDPKVAPCCNIKHKYCFCN